MNIAFSFCANLALLITLQLGSSHLYGQPQSYNDYYDSTFSKQSKHSINLELGGRILFIATLNYEYSLTDRLTISGGWGINSIDRSEIIRNNNGVTEKGQYFGLYSAAPISGMYLFGKYRHRLLLTTGLTYYWRHETMKYPSEKIVESAYDVQWNAGIGYQLTGMRTYLRTTMYCLALPNISRYAPSYLPWLGVCLGYKL